MPHSFRGPFSGVRIVTLGQGEELSLTHCAACGSEDVQQTRKTEQSVDFMEPVKGEPYPTLAVHEQRSVDCVCRGCGNHWGRSEILDERIPQEHVAIDVHTRKPINDPEEWGY